MYNETRGTTAEFSVNFTIFPEVGRPPESRSRYLWIGLCGVALNGIAVLYLCFSRKVKPTLRATMIGLSLNDLVFNADLTLLGYPNWSLVSQTLECWTVTFVMIASVVVSYFITIQLSLHNYLAVFHPFHSNVVLSVFRCTTAVVASYLLGYLLSLACLGLSFDPRLPCYVLAVVPRSGLAIACGTCLSCSLVVVAVNLKVCMKIRRRKMAVQSEISARHARLCHVFDVHSSFKIHQPSGKPASLKNNHAQFAEDINNVIHQNTGDHSTSNGTLILTLTAPCYSREVVDTRHNELLCNNVYKEQPSSSELLLLRNEYKEQSTAQSNAYNEQPTTSANINYLFQNTASDQNRPTLTNNFQKCRNLIPTNHTAGSIQQPEFIETGDVIPVLNREDNPNGVCRRDRVTGKNPEPIKYGCGSRPRSGTSNTLAMMTWCSCLLTFPLLVEMIYGIVWVNDRLQFLTNWFGMLVSSLLTAHGLSNPLLYAWRFIEWHGLYKKMRDGAAKWRPVVHQALNGTDGRLSTLGSRVRSSVRTT